MNQLSGLFKLHKINKLDLVSPDIIQFEKFIKFSIKS